MWLLRICSASSVPSIGATPAVNGFALNYPPPNNGPMTGAIDWSARQAIAKPPLLSTPMRNIIIVAIAAHYTFGVCPHSPVVHAGGSGSFGGKWPIPSFGSWQLSNGRIYFGSTERNTILFYCWESDRNSARQELPEINRLPRQHC